MAPRATDSSHRTQTLDRAVARMNFEWNSERATLGTRLFAISAFVSFGLNTLGCHSAQPPSPAPARGSASSAPEVRASSKFGYSWTLPQGWRFGSPGNLWPAPASPAFDAIVATSDEGPIVLVLVTDPVTTVPGLKLSDHSHAYEELAKHGESYLRDAGVEPVATRPVSMLGLSGAEVSADPISDGISVRSFYRGNRRFQFICFEPGYESEWRCGSAFTSFRITDVPEGPTENDVPRVRHLRDERFGFAFDAPDDSWLSIGPRLGWGGVQVVYVWRKATRQIDVGTLDLAATAQPPTEADFASQLAAKQRKDGAVVVVKDDTLGGLPCHRLQVDKSSGSKQDAYILIRNNVLYMVLVTQPIRDSRLLRAVKKGFRLTAK